MFSSSAEVKEKDGFLLSTLFGCPYNMFQNIPHSLSLLLWA